MLSYIKKRSFGCYAIIFITALHSLSCGPREPGYLRDTYIYDISMITPDAAIFDDHDSTHPVLQIGSGKFKTKIVGTVYAVEPDILSISINCGLLTAADLHFDWEGVRVYEWNSKTATKGNDVDFTFDLLMDGQLYRIGNKSFTHLSFVESVREKPLYFEIPLSAATGESLVLGFVGTPERN